MSEKDIKQFFDNLAPKWDSLEMIKDDHIIELFKKIGIKKNDEILDVGCGTGRVTYILHALSESSVTGVDLSSNMIDIAKDKYKNETYATFLCEDFLEYDLQKKFDIIVIYNAYPHFLDLEKLNNALKRNLKDGGRFAIIHSLGRTKLQDVHSDLNTSVSRYLEDPITEGKHFSKDFEILTAEEDDNSFVLVCKKRS